MGIVSDRGSRGKGFVTTGQGSASPKQGWTRERGERPDPPEGRESATGAQAAVPPRTAGRGRECQAGRRGRAHEMSHTGTGRVPGRRRPTTCRRPKKWGTEVLKRIPLLLQLRGFRNDDLPGTLAPDSPLCLRRSRQTRTRTGTPVRLPDGCRVGRKRQGAGYRMVAEPQEVAKGIPWKPAAGGERRNPGAPPRAAHRDLAEHLRPQMQKLSWNLPPHHILPGQGGPYLGYSTESTTSRIINLLRLYWI